MPGAGVLPYWARYCVLSRGASRPCPVTSAHAGASADTGLGVGHERDSEAAPFEHAETAAAATTTAASPAFRMFTIPIVPSVTHETPGQLPETA